MAAKTAISPTRSEDYPEWYQQVVKAGELAETSVVRGCMVIKPWGYRLWENIQKVLDAKFKATGHENAYFPLFIPKSFIEKEAKHIEGFAKECAVVTHHRLADDGQGGLKPDGELEEPLVVRPTSETIIGASFAKWIQSYRDLPLLINQWANVVRWELRTRLFLRTTEFLWQEGHTAHATAEEAMAETRQMLEVYREFAENYMAMPVITGEKSESERFPGAVNTFSIEALMQDRKALQAGTSHFLGQKFARASEIKFQDKAGQEVYAWTTSWGVSTRLIGGLVMTHSDDNGLVLPPRLAPAQVVILPIIHKEENRSTVLEYCEKLATELRALSYHHQPLEVVLDSREGKGGEKTWQWIKKGVPLRLEIGPRDIAADSAFVGRRDRDSKDRFTLTRGELVATLTQILDDIQAGLLKRARDFRDEHTREINDRDEFYKFFTPQNREQPEAHGGFALCHWDGETETEKKIKEELNVTIRTIPLTDQPESGRCIFTGKPSPQRVIFARAY